MELGSIQKRVGVAFSIILLTFLSYAEKAEAQDFGLRVIGGGGINIPETNFAVDNDPVFGGGIGAELGFNDFFSINMDVQGQMLSIKGTISEDDEGMYEVAESIWGSEMAEQGIPYGRSFFNLNTQVYAKFSFPFREAIPPYHFREPWKFNFLIGGFFSYAIDKSLEGPGLPDDDDFTILLLHGLPNFFEDFDFGLVGGAGITYDVTTTIGIGLDARYHFGLFNQSASIPPILAEEGFAVPSYESYNRYITGNLHVQYNF